MNFINIKIIRGVKLLFLPPYSCDFNPIEEGFSGVKAWIRRHQTETRVALSSKDYSDAERLLIRAVFNSFTQDNIRGWYRDCGYTPPPLNDVNVF